MDQLNIKSKNLKKIIIIFALSVVVLLTAVALIIRIVNPSFYYFNSYKSKLYETAASSGPSYSFKYPDSWISQESVTRENSGGDYFADSAYVLSKTSSSAIELRCGGSYGGGEPPQVELTEIKKLPDMNSLIFESENPEVKTIWERTNKETPDLRIYDVNFVNGNHRGSSNDYGLYAVLDANQTNDINFFTYRGFYYYGYCSFICEYDKSQITNEEKDEIVNIMSTFKIEPTNLDQNKVAESKATINGKTFTSKDSYKNAGSISFKEDGTVQLGSTAFYWKGTIGKWYTGILNAENKMLITLKEANSEYGTTNLLYDKNTDTIIGPTSGDNKTIYYKM